ncbi:alpha-mannosidase 2-like [Halyomorpha halys]|uniref:alpha-mannosidase 2-like n=1 Tax=Halyomorpha halys TaxID=286706 RepID=UPI0034D21930
MILHDLNLNLTDARSSLSLFQHHDGITGTAKDHVVQDYADKMLQAIHKCQHVIQLSTYALLNIEKLIEYSGKEIFFTIDEHQKVPYNLAEGIVLTFSPGVLSRKVFIFNPLTSDRIEVISVRVGNKLVQVS